MIASGAEEDEAFVLDVRVVIDSHTCPGAVPCATDDGCGHTCTSACNSNA